MTLWNPAGVWWMTVEKRVAVVSGVRRKFSWGGFIQWHMVVICIWCALFITSQFDVIFMLPNHPFREICWYAMHVLLHALTLIYVWSIESVRLVCLTHTPVCKVDSC